MSEIVEIVDALCLGTKQNWNFVTWYNLLSIYRITDNCLDVLPINYFVGQNVGIINYSFAFYTLLSYIYTRTYGTPILTNFLTCSSSSDNTNKYIVYIYNSRFDNLLLNDPMFLERKGSFIGRRMLDNSAPSPHLLDLPK